MTFTESISTCFSKYASFSGRASRSEFWWFALFLAIVDIGLSLVSEALSGIWNLATLLPYAAVAWRRLHDIDRTGLWTLAPLIPMVLVVIALVTAQNFGDFGPLFWVGVIATAAMAILNIIFWATAGTPVRNEYGEDPLP
jgi:uncharacterized membrane protein YhaH (DUF805 family)